MGPPKCHTERAIRSRPPFYLYRSVGRPVIRPARVIISFCLFFLTTLTTRAILGISYLVARQFLTTRRTFFAPTVPEPRFNLIL